MAARGLAVVQAPVLREKRGSAFWFAIACRSMSDRVAISPQTSLTLWVLSASRIPSMGPRMLSNDSPITEPNIIPPTQTADPVQPGNQRSGNMAQNQPKTSSASRSRSVRDSRRGISQQTARERAEQIGPQFSTGGVRIACGHENFDRNKRTIGAKKVGGTCQTSKRIVQRQCVFKPPGLRFCQMALAKTPGGGFGVPEIFQRASFRLRFGHTLSLMGCRSVLKMGLDFQCDAFKCGRGKFFGGDGQPRLQGMFRAAHGVGVMCGMGAA